MDLTQLANLGEFIGGVAVLVTLAYLALQAAQTVKQSRLASLQMASLGWAERIEGILTDDERRNVWVVGLRGLSALPPAGRLKFHGILIGSISTFENLFHLHRSGVLPADQFAVYERDVVAILRSPGPSAWWEQVRHRYFSQGVKSHIDGILKTFGSEVAPLSDVVATLMGGDEPQEEAIGLDAENPSRAGPEA